ncbi:hypothetical protein LINGRAPRIM_LOCUS1757 [Linum grandiflorum]
MPLQSRLQAVEIHHLRSQLQSPFYCSSPE